MDDLVEADFNSRYASLKNDLVGDALDSLQEQFKNLEYFRTYLFSALSTVWMTTPKSVTTTVSNEDDLVRSVRSQISSLAPASLTIGGYDESRSENECYPGIDSYISQNKMELRRWDVENIYSAKNVAACAVDAVKSMPFFSNKAYETHSGMDEART